MMVFIWVLVTAVLFFGLGYLLGQKNGKVDGYDLGYAQAWRGLWSLSTTSDSRGFPGIEGGKHKW